MIDKFVLFAIFAVAAQGDVVLRNSRQGNLNTYFLYTRAHDDARTPVKLPTAKELEDMSDTVIPAVELEEIPYTGIPTEDLEVTSNTEETPNNVIPELNAALDTIVVVHGHGGDKDTQVNPIIKDSFFDERARPDIDVNVIVVDWSSYTKQSYSVASGAVQSVGKALGEYLKLLVEKTGINVDQLHLVGFNLGAHVVGFAGRELNGEAARITGLDPSASNWGSRSPRLSKTDARYVEVIHTDGDCLLCNGIGEAIGDVDFFVNGGSNQPGCLTHSCSHNRAYELFAATLVRGEYLDGHLCNSKLQLALNACRGSPVVHVGGDDLFKRHGTQNMYRVNTGRTFPY